jgi:hypothetical protein
MKLRRMMRNDAQTEVIDDHCACGVEQNTEGRVYRYIYCFVLTTSSANCGAT